MTTTDPIDVLARNRPTADRLDQLWSPGAREDLLRRTLNRALNEPAHRPSRGRFPTRRRVAVLTGVAVAAAAAVLTGPAVLSPSHAPQAVALDGLASVAGSRPAVVIPAGQFMRMTIVDEPDADAGRGHFPQTNVTWTDATGNIWGKISTAQRPADFAYFPHPKGNSVNYPSPAYARTLPTQPAALEAYLRARVDGSISQDEAVFTAIGDMLRLGYIPAQVRAAAIKTLGQLPEVSTKPATTVNHRRGLRVDFTDQHARPGMVQSLIFDPTTADLIQESLTQNGVVQDVSVKTHQALVTAVPATVKHNAIYYQE